MLQGLNKMNVGNFIENNARERSMTYRKVNEKIVETSVPSIFAIEGDVVGNSIEQLQVAIAWKATVLEKK